MRALSEVHIRHYSTFSYTYSSHITFLIVSFMYTILPQCVPRTVKRVLDKNLTFHKAVAWMIIAASAMHIMAHYYNYERIAAIVRVGPLVPTEGPRPPLQALPVASVPPGTPLVGTQWDTLMAL